jgi:hypothetical protein
MVWMKRQQDDEETTMWFKDAIGKALGEAAGKVAAEAQALLASEIRGLAWRVRLPSTLRLAEMSSSYQKIRNAFVCRLGFRVQQH